ncbi:MAG: hypothetical protein GF401_17390 [Chitinivibrionales bacterium]|nr:hypothetical protein [Chitinivibrionales bacterium]
MGSFLMGCLGASIIFFLLMISIQLVKMEKKIINAVTLIEVKLGTRIRK